MGRMHQQKQTKLLQLLAAVSHDMDETGMRAGGTLMPGGKRNAADTRVAAGEGRSSACKQGGCICRRRMYEDEAG